MSTEKILGSVVLLLFWATVTVAQNKATVSQAGRGQQIIVVQQEGQPSVLTVKQMEGNTGQQVSISQAGRGNQVSISQRGATTADSSGAGSAPNTEIRYRTQDGHGQLRVQQDHQTTTVSIPPSGTYTHPNTGVVSPGQEQPTPRPRSLKRRKRR